MKEKLDRVNRYTSVNSVCLKVSEVWVCLQQEGGSLQGVLLAGLDQYEGSAGQRVELLKFGFINRKVEFFKGFCWLDLINKKVQLLRGGGASKVWVCLQEGGACQGVLVAWIDHHDGTAAQ